MAPDLNSVPASPRPSTDSTRQSNATLSNSRRASQQMPPPPLPLSPVISNILPSNQQAVANMPPLHSPGLMPDQTAVGIGPGPLRHPRPLTAAELHMQLEKEQEAVVRPLFDNCDFRVLTNSRSIVLHESFLFYEQQQMHLWLPTPPQPLRPAAFPTQPTQTQIICCLVHLILYPPLADTNDPVRRLLRDQLRVHRSQITTSLA